MLQAGLMLAGHKRESVRREERERTVERAFTDAATAWPVKHGLSPSAALPTAPPAPASCIAASSFLLISRFVSCTDADIQVQAGSSDDSYACC